MKINLHFLICCLIISLASQAVILFSDVYMKLFILTFEALMIALLLNEGSEGELKKHG